jgi:hypothetical protein
MSRKLKISALGAGLCIIFLIAPALAAPPLDAHIVVSATIDPDPDPFVASGSAVSAGMLCSSGQATDLSVDVTSPPSGKFNILKVLKHFECDDESGTFDVKLVVKLDLTTHETTAQWIVVGGTGSYAALHGSGKLVGTPIVPGESITDVYDGKIH